MTSSSSTISTAKGTHATRVTSTSTITATSVNNANTLTSSSTITSTSTDTSSSTGSTTSTKSQTTEYKTLTSTKPSNFSTSNYLTSIISATGTSTSSSSTTSTKRKITETKTSTRPSNYLTYPTITSTSSMTSSYSTNTTTKGSHTTNKTSTSARPLNFSTSTFSTSNRSSLAKTFASLMILTSPTSSSILASSSKITTPDTYTFTITRTSSTIITNTSTSTATNIQPSSVFTLTFTSTITTIASINSTSLILTSTPLTSTTSSSPTSTTTTLNLNDKLMVLLSNMRLINHWNFDNNNLDLKSGAPLLIQNTLFVNDRFGNEKSAIAFTFGQMRIPGFYFRDGFSVLAWIYITQVDAIEQSLLYCEDQNKTNKLTLRLQSGNNKNSYFSINSNTASGYAGSQYKLPIKKWIHVGATLDSNQVANIWQNGTSVSGDITFKKFPKNLTWTDCYIGYSSINAPNLNLYLDDLMLFGAGLAESEINTIKDNPIVRPFVPIAIWQFNGNLINGATNVPLSSSMTDVTFVTDRQGMANSAILFNTGTMQIPNCPYLSYTNTIMLWIKLTSVANQGLFLFRDATTLEGFKITLNASNCIIFPTKEQSVQIPLQLNVWSHVAMVQKGLLVDYFANGAFLVSNSQPTWTIETFICQFGTSANHLLANLDDVMFFDHALSDSEVRVFMNLYD